MKKTNLINNELLQSAMTYEQYTDLLNTLFLAGKTTGENQSEAMLNYAKINLQRMKRLNKTVTLTQKMKSVLKDNKTKMIWLVITEGWCGDAAQNIPVLNKITNFSPEIELRLLLRDEHPELMNEFLTNGSKSIPKLIALNNNLQVLGTWGPRPEEVQKMVEENKKNPKTDSTEFIKQVQLWYLKDITESVQAELAKKISEWSIEIQ